jgi:hypothetical protein
MKYTILFIMAVFLLAGCASGAQSASPTVSVMPTPATSEKADATVSQMLTSTSFITPTPTFSTSESMNEYLTTPLQQPAQDGFPQLSSREPNPALGISKVAVSNEKTLYYVVAVDTQRGDRIYTVDDIYMQDLKSNKTVKINSTDKTINSVFLDMARNFYYSCWYPYDNNSIKSELHKCENNKDVLLFDNFSHIIRIDDVFVYYTDIDDNIMKYNLLDGSGIFIWRYPEAQSFSYGVEYMQPMTIRPLYFLTIYLYKDDENDRILAALDLTNGNLYQVLPTNSNFIFSDDGENLVAYVADESETRFQIYNYNTFTLQSVSLPFTSTISVML